MDTTTNNTEKSIHTKRHVVKVGGFLREIVTIRDATGNILERMTHPLMLEFYPRDLMQAILGAAILATPVALTEEVWKLGETLSLIRVGVLAFISFCFLALFVYYNFYKGHFAGYQFEFLKRVLSIYLLSFAVVGIIMSVIGQAPWATDWVLAVKRIVIATLPASLSAAIADLMK